jgi:hypothetical protein
MDMSAIDTSDLESDFGEAAAAEGTRKSLMSRVLDALHRSRQIQAAREIERHKHLIAEWREYGARKRKR